MRSQTADPTVLLVEDHATNRLLARMILERAGYRVLEARSSDDARQHLRQVMPHVILMDIGLPGQDGLSFTRELKSSARTSAIPVVVLTARVMPRDRERAFAVGCDAFLSKPFGAQQLVSVIEEVLRGASNVRTDRTSEGDGLRVNT